MNAAAKANDVISNFPEAIVGDMEEEIKRPAVK